MKKSKKKVGQGQYEKNMDSFFCPKSVAIIGASRDPNSVGQGVMVNLIKGGFFQSEYSRPYNGKIYPVNPNAETILGMECYPNLKAIKDDVDLAIVCVPAKIVLDVIKECAAKKVKGIIIISSGFSELGIKGQKMQEKIVEILKRAKIPMIGPNCLGVIRPSSRLNASFAPSMPPEGNVAFLSQSGALADSIIDWAINMRYGFSGIVSYGNAADVGLCELVEWFGEDEKTKAITIYSEGIKDGKRFIESVKKVSKKKPIIILKAGRSEESAKAAMSHTGNIAGSYDVFRDVMKQNNVFVAKNIHDMFDLAKAFAFLGYCKENSIGIITNGGGVGVLCADYCQENGINLFELNKKMIKKLDKTMHPSYSKRNPLDLIGDALPDKYETALEIMLSEDKVSGAIVIQTLQTMTKPEQTAKIIVEAKKKYTGKAIITVFMGGRFMSRAIYILEKNKIPNYSEVEHAVDAMAALIKRKDQRNGGNNNKDKNNNNNCNK